MSNTTASSVEPELWREHLVLTRDLTIPAERTDFYRRARSGEFARVMRGAYLPSRIWDSLDGDARYRALTAAAWRPEFIYSHHSAAALWRLPWIGAWPQRVHVAAQREERPVSSRTVVRHATDIPRVFENIDGFRVATLGRTVIDVASTVSFERGVAVADAALRRSAHPLSGVPTTALTKGDLLDELSRIHRNHGQVKARTVVEFANGLADRPGESLSRVSMHRARLPTPELQVPLRGRSGRLWHVDFWWPEHNLIGEFDGEWKYTDRQFANGRTPHQILLDEKFREDDLRATGCGFTRWGWEAAKSPARLRHILTQSGLV